MRHFTILLAFLAFTFLASIGYTAEEGAACSSASCASCPSACESAAVENAVEGEQFRNFTCPVTGEPAVPSIQAAHNGIVYCFATEEARDTFLAAPEDYLDKLPNKGGISDLRNEFCPVTGTAAQKSYFGVVNGQKIHTKCAATRAMLLRAPQHYYDEAQANLDLTEKEIKAKYKKVPRYNNRTCPVTGEPADRNLVVEYNDIAYYVSSEEAQEQFNADPEKYLSTLPNKGAIVDMGNDFCPMKMEKLEGTKYVVTVEGHKIYTGCRACALAILKEPEAYIAKVKKLMALPKEELDKLIKPAGACEAEKAGSEG